MKRIAYLLILLMVFISACAPKENPDGTTTPLPSGKEVANILLTILFVLSTVVYYICFIIMFYDDDIESKTEFLIGLIPFGVPLYRGWNKFRDL